MCCCKFGKFGEGEPRVRENFRTSKDTYLETVGYEMDMLEFLPSGVYEKPPQYTKVASENKAPPSTVEACSI